MLGRVQCSWKALPKPEPKPPRVFSSCGECRFPKEIFLPKDARGSGTVGRLRREVLATWLEGVMGGTELGV